MKIFVFGSNLAGRHGAGSALEARRNWGAVYGKGVGFHGQSYAIPTKDQNLKVLSLSEIRWYVKEFIKYARNHKEHNFYLVPIGCGLAGYQPSDIAPMFKRAPPNISIPDAFQPFLTNLGRSK